MSQKQTILNYLPLPLKHPVSETGSVTIQTTQHNSNLTFFVVWGGLEEAGFGSSLLGQKSVYLKVTQGPFSCLDYLQHMGFFEFIRSLVELTPLRAAEWLCLPKERSH